MAPENMELVDQWKKHTIVNFPARNGRFQYNTIPLLFPDGDMPKEVSCLTEGTYCSTRDYLHMVVYRMTAQDIAYDLSTRTTESIKGSLTLERATIMAKSQGSRVTEILSANCEDIASSRQIVLARNIRSDSYDDQESTRSYFKMADIAYVPQNEIIPVAVGMRCLTNMLVKDFRKRRQKQRDIEQRMDASLSWI